MAVEAQIRVLVVFTPGFLAHTDNDTDVTVLC
jgi:hypothetical protein